MTARENIAKLPDRCAAILLEDGSPIMITLGGRGYTPASPLLDPKAYNERRGITPNQVWAMMNGSAFGWDIPAADPDTPGFASDPYKPAGH